MLPAAFSACADPTAGGSSRSTEPPNSRFLISVFSRAGRKGRIRTCDRRVLARCSTTELLFSERRRSEAVPRNACAQHGRTRRRPAPIEGLSAKQIQQKSPGFLRGRQSFARMMILIPENSVRAASGRCRTSRSLWLVLENIVVRAISSEHSVQLRRGGTYTWEDRVVNEKIFEVQFGISNLEFENEKKTFTLNLSRRERGQVTLRIGSLARRLTVLRGS